MTMTREAEIRRKSTEARFAGLEPIDGLLHPEPQQVLVQRLSKVRAKDMRQIKGRYAELAGEVSDAMGLRGVGRHQLLCVCDQGCPALHTGA